MTTSLLAILTSLLKGIASFMKYLSDKQLIEAGKSVQNEKTLEKALQEKEKIIKIINDVNDLDINELKRLRKQRKTNNSSSK